MSCPMASTASGTMGCWPTRPARPILQRSAPCSGHRALNTRPCSRRPRPRHSPCANPAHAAAAPCASLRSSGAARNPVPARHRGSRQHDETPDHRIDETSDLPAAPARRPFAKRAGLQTDTPCEPSSVDKSAGHAPEPSCKMGPCSFQPHASCGHSPDRQTSFPIG